MTEYDITISRDGCTLRVRRGMIVAEYDGYTTKWLTIEIPPIVHGLTVRRYSAEYLTAEQFAGSDLALLAELRAAMARCRAAALGERAATSAGGYR